MPPAFAPGFFGVTLPARREEQYLAAMLIPSISQVPPGSQDLLPSDVRRRRHVQRVWFALADENRYEEVIPPTFEYEDVFTRGGGAELARRLIRFVDRDGHVVALRADFTSSLARVAATKLRHAPLPLRLSYAGKVYRNEAEDGGRQRELFQLGAELIGEAGAQGDLEILRLVVATLRALQITDFQINVGDIRFILPLVSELPTAASELLRNAIDRRDRRALADTAAELNVPARAREALVALPTLIGRGDMLDRAAKLAASAEAEAAIATLREVDSRLDMEEKSHIVYDLGEILWLGYYSGLQFEVFVAGFGRTVGYGGRYDQLLALYGADRPAVGFALEIDALAGLAGGVE
jgi:ATP phosphoribosyltransferase regulatory subunit